MQVRNNSGIIIGGDATFSGGSRLVNQVGLVGRERSGPSPREGGVDVLIITALKDEYDAVKGAIGESAQWQEHGAGGSEPYSTAQHHTSRGKRISIALARPTQMGGRSIAAITATLTNQLQPTCLAMCGVCAGNPRDTAPGDVVVAAPAYEWDEGKHIGDEFHADHQQFPQDTRWVRAAQDYEPWSLPSYGTATDEEAVVWFLERLHKGQDPRKHPARDRYFTRQAWGERLGQLSTDGLIVWRDTRWDLTEAGQAYIQRVMYNDAYGPERLPFAVHVGPMASGSAVMKDPGVWDRLEVTQRRILAIEMEAATIATIAHERQVPHWLVAKGVMDHADFEKDDRFKAFAAKASIEVLLALLESLLPPAGTSSACDAPTVPVPGTVKLEIVRRLTYDWQDLADVVGVPAYEMRRFRAGDEPRDLWAWLENRDRLGDLPGALDEIGRSDLAGLLRPYTE